MEKMTKCECGKEYMVKFNRCPGCFRKNTDPEYKKYMQKLWKIMIPIAVILGAGIIVGAIFIIKLMASIF